MKTHTPSLCSAGETYWGPRRDLLCEQTSEVNGAEMHTPGVVSATPLGPSLTQAGIAGEGEIDCRDLKAKAGPLPQ